MHHHNHQATTNHTNNLNTGYGLLGFASTSAGVAPAPEPQDQRRRPARVVASCEAQRGTAVTARGYHSAQEPRVGMAGPTWRVARHESHGLVVGGTARWGRSAARKPQEGERSWPAGAVAPRVVTCESPLRHVASPGQRQDGRVGSVPREIPLGGAAAPRQSRRAATLLPSDPARRIWARQSRRLTTQRGAKKEAVRPEMLAV